MTAHYDTARLALELTKVSPLVAYVSPHSERIEGAQAFVFSPTRRLTTDETVSICRDMATVVRREVPERPDGWAVRIHADQYGPPSLMGVYFVGWAGRADEWRLREGQERKATDYADWLALLDRLRKALSAIGTEGGRALKDGDFRLMNEECGRYEQTLFFYQPEFLTKELIAAIQNVLRDGYSDWVVSIAPDFGPPFKALWEGIQVRADSVKEEWDRREMEELFGDRLKI